MANTTNTTPRVKEYVDYAQRQVDEQTILDKYNAATIAQFNAQREQNRIAENKFYNQMYNTQRTAMDTIRKANASAVTTGASRGVQAANELSALLGLEQESVASATELAQANRQTAQEETAAVLENVLNAYQQANQERSQLTQQAIEAASLDATEAQARAAQEDAATKTKEYERNLHTSDPELYYQEQAEKNNAADVKNLTDEQFNKNMTIGMQAVDALADKLGYAAWDDFWETLGGGNITNKSNSIKESLRQLYKTYGLDASYADKVINGLPKVVYGSMTLLHDDGNMAAKQYLRRTFYTAYNAARTQQD